MNLPFTGTFCYGSFTISTFSAQVGSPPGVKLQLAISLRLDENTTLNGQRLNSNFAILVTSLTLAKRSPRRDLGYGDCFSYICLN